MEMKLRQGSVAHLITISGAPGNATLASAAYSALSAEYDNATYLMPFGTFEIYAGFSVAPTAGRRLLLYLIPALDGTNYALTPEAGVDHPLVGWCSVKAGTDPQRHAFVGVDGQRAIALPPHKFKTVVLDDTDQQVAANWTVDLYPFDWQAA